MVDPRWPTLYLIVATAALIGAVVSFFLTPKHIVEVKERAKTRDVSSLRAG